eukprot:256817_1
MTSNTRHKRCKTEYDQPHDQVTIWEGSPPAVPPTVLRYSHFVSHYLMIVTIHYKPILNHFFDGIPCPPSCDVSSIIMPSLYCGSFGASSFFVVMAPILR